MSDTQRLFFALWPDAAVRAQLAEASHRWTRRPVVDANLHMTLLFLGDCDLEQQCCFTQAASSIISEPFELKLDYLGAWQRSRIQWLGATQMPEALDDLLNALKAALEACGFEGEKRRFVPHVTLSRKVTSPRPRAGLPAITWAVNDFVLVESLPLEGGVRYEVRARWPLG